MIVILALFAVKEALRLVPNTLDLSVSASVLADASLVLAIGLTSAQRLEMWLRAQRLLSEAQAAKDSAPSASPPIVS